MSKRAIFDKKNVLVTGGAGFLGSHLCDELIKECKVICLDNFSTGDESNIDHLLSDPNFEFIRQDINEDFDLEKMPELQKFKIEFQGIQEIYHLACPTSPANFENNIKSTLHSLSVGMRNVLELAVKYNTKFMHASSSVVYGPLREGNPKIKEGDYGVVNFLSERSSYDEGKRFAETMVKNYREIHEIDAKIVRIFRTYGPRMKLNDGQMIPDFITNALDGKDLAILGNKDFSSSFCYVSDVIDAMMKMMESDYMGPVNIGSDVSLNLSDLAQKIIRLVGSESRIVYMDDILFMTSLCLPDISLARDQLGWLPVVTIEKGLEKTIDDLRASKGLVNVKSLRPHN